MPIVFNLTQDTSGQTIGRIDPELTAEMQEIEYFNDQLDKLGGICSGALWTSI
jgi:hypothetical protein